MKKSFPVQLNNGQELFIKLAFVTKLEGVDAPQTEKAGGIALKKWGVWNWEMKYFELKLRLED